MEESETKYYLLEYLSFFMLQLITLNLASIEVNSNGPIYNHTEVGRERIIFTGGSYLTIQGINLEYVLCCSSSH
jgi:protein tyrosine/serine phosphatase